MPYSSSRLLGNYRLVRLLGQGGFAHVYLGEHVHLNTYAAIKVLRTQLAEDGTDYFRTEARMLARLKHPNIVQVQDFGVEDMTPYLIMTYAPNGTLRQRHPRGIPLTLNVVVSYVKQMASALQYAHNQKLVHRDVKPENMLVGEQNQLLLSDFGIAVMTASARVADPYRADPSWDSAGTVSYMAPEQLQGKTTPASDQYALAIVVYEWLTGRPPFKGSYMEIVAQHISTSPPSLREQMPSIPPEVEQVILTALNKDPQQRFERIEVFAHALEEAAQNALATNNETDYAKNLEVNTLEAALISSLGRIVIGTAKMTIGRSPDNTIVLSDSKASSHHAEIRQEGPNYNLVDLGSVNGTFVNEQRVYEMPRRLQSRDIIRIGETQFTFEVSNTLESTVQMPSPPLGGYDVTLRRNSGGNSGHGIDDDNYELHNRETISGRFTPPKQPDPKQQAAYTPLPSVQRSSRTRIILLAAIALIVILAGVGGFSIYHTNQVNLANGYATATAQTNRHNAIVNATATAVTQQHIAATATSVVNATATAIATSHYPPFTNLGLNDSLLTASSNWDTSSICQFTPTGYQVSNARASNFQFCLHTGLFSESAFQVTMSIQQGDCGGLVFRRFDNNNQFIFYVCQNGTYNLFFIINNNNGKLYSSDQASAAIQQGLNSQNTIAITVQGDTMNMYVNGKNIAGATSPILQTTLSQGSIGLVANDQPDPTSVVYTNALLWTAS